MTAYRIVLLEETPTGAPKVVLSDDEAAELSAELMRIEHAAHQKIVEAMHDGSRSTSKE